MAPVAPTLHAFDPLIAGTVGLRIDPPASATQVSWYVGQSVPGGPYTQIATNYIHTGFNGQAILANATASLYWVAKVTDGTGTSGNSNEVQAPVSAGAPVLTAQQHLAAALGNTVSVNDTVAYDPASSAVIKKVQADGSLA